MTTKEIQATLHMGGEVIERQFAELLSFIENKRSEASQAVNEKQLHTAWVVGGYVSEQRNRPIDNWTISNRKYCPDGIWTINNANICPTCGWTNCAIPNCTNGKVAKIHSNENPFIGITNIAGMMIG